MSDCSYQEYKAADCELKAIWDNKVKLDIRTIFNGDHNRGKLMRDWVSYTYILAAGADKEGPPTLTGIDPKITAKLTELGKLNNNKRFFSYYIPISLIDDKIKELISVEKMEDSQYMGLSGDIIKCDEQKQRNTADNQFMVPVNCSRSGWNDLLLSKDGTCPEKCGNSELISGFEYPRYRAKIESNPVPPEYLEECSRAADAAAVADASAAAAAATAVDVTSPGDGTDDQIPDGGSVSSYSGESDEYDESDESDEYDESDELVENVDMPTVKVRPYDISDEDNIILRIRMKSSAGGLKHNKAEEFINDIRKNLAEPFPYLFMIHSRRWISYNFSIIEAGGDIIYDYINLPVDVVFRGPLSSSDPIDTINIIMEMLGEWFEDRDAGSNPELFDYCAKLGLLSDGS